MVTKQELIVYMNASRGRDFNKRYYNFFTDMRQAADSGRDYVIFENTKLTEEFLEYLLKEEFSVYKKSHLYDNKWLPITDKKETLYPNETILISWGEENE